MGPNGRRRGVSLSKQHLHAALVGCGRCYCRRLRVRGGLARPSTCRWSISLCGLSRGRAFNCRIKAGGVHYIPCVSRHQGRVLQHFW